MASQYNSRKEQLAGTPKVNVGDVEIEIQKVRSSTPKPVSRIQKEEVVPALSSVQQKKIVYKHELEDIKSKIDLVESTHKEFKENFSQVLDDHKKSLSDLVDVKMDENKKAIESLRIENLKNVLNDSIAKMNEQLKAIASQLVSHGDAVNELKSRMADVEAIL